MAHDFQDAVSLEIARRVSSRLRQSPALLEVARANIRRWTLQNATAPALLRCYSEWEEILTRPLDDICELLCADSDDAQRLRQNSPFAGVLPAAEVWEIKRRFRRVSTPA